MSTRGQQGRQLRQPQTSGRQTTLSKKRRRDSDEDSVTELMLEEEAEDSSESSSSGSTRRRRAKGSKGKSSATSAHASSKHTRRAANRAAAHRCRERKMAALERAELALITCLNDHAQLQEQAAAMEQMMLREAAAVEALKDFVLSHTQYIGRQLPPDAAAELQRLLQDPVHPEAALFPEGTFPPSVVHTCATASVSSPSAAMVPCSPPAPPQAVMARDTAATSPPTSGGTTLSTLENNAAGVPLAMTAAHMESAPDMLRRTEVLQHVGKQPGTVTQPLKSAAPKAAAPRAVPAAAAVQQPQVHTQAAHLQTPFAAGQHMCEHFAPLQPGRAQVPAGEEGPEEAVMLMHPLANLKMLAERAVLIASP